MDKFKNKYRIASARAGWWDYSWAGAYFITICTQDRIHYFGKIVRQRMILSPTGVLADVFWNEIPKHFRNVELGAFVIMPNHMHGILIIKPPCLPENPNHQTPSTAPNIGAKRFQNPGKNSISSIVGSYKSAVTRHANRLGFEFGWQSRFHDHIIRNDAEYQRINDYIETNPIKWPSDRFHSTG
jgi:putative transposase